MAGLTNVGFIGRTVNPNRIAVWNATAPTASGVLPPVGSVGGDDWIQVAGIDGTYVDGDALVHHLRTYWGAYVPIPSVHRPDEANIAPLGLSQGGTLAFTGRFDGLVHFFRCH
jgi:hypothetical protein